MWKKMVPEDWDKEIEEWEKEKRLELIPLSIGQYRRMLEETKKYDCVDTPGKSLVERCKHKDTGLWDDPYPMLVYAMWSYIRGKVNQME